MVRLADPPRLARTERSRISSFIEVLLPQVQGSWWHEILQGNRESDVGPGVRIMTANDRENLLKALQAKTPYPRYWLNRLSNDQLFRMNQRIEYKEYNAKMKAGKTS